MSEKETNTWCELIGVRPPRIENVVSHPDANTFSLLLMALLERGRPMTLAEVADRFERAGIATQADALLSLQRCKPGRPPVYREGDLYHLDPRDDELDLWLFRLGLRPPKIARPAPPPAAAPLPDPQTALSTQELDEAWKDANLWSWSAQRLALAVLDAHGSPLAPETVVNAVAKRTRWHRLTEPSAKFKRRGSAVAVLDDGQWAIAPDAPKDAVKHVRTVVRARIAMVRRHASYRPDPATLEANRQERERLRTRHAAELAKLSRALIVTFPPNRPQFAVLLDVGRHTLEAFGVEQLEALRELLSNYDVLGGVDIRATLRALGFEPGDRRLAELGPPQKSKQINKRGRTLKITTALLVQGSCGISRPFGEPSKLAEYLTLGATAKLLRRLEADAKSLYALYQYGRLHGAVRLHWGFIDERIPAPWVHRDERLLCDLKESAFAMGAALEVVTGNAPGWEQPWARARTARVVREGYRYVLLDESGQSISDAEVQLARLSAMLH